MKILALIGFTIVFSAQAFADSGLSVVFPSADGSISSLSAPMREPPEIVETKHGRFLILLTYDDNFYDRRDCAISEELARTSGFPHLESLKTLLSDYLTIKDRTLVLTCASTTPGDWHRSANTMRFDSAGLMFIPERIEIEVHPWQKEKPIKGLIPRLWNKLK